MSERANIQWTTATWNHWRGCTQVSPGCAHYYMFTARRRYGHDPAVVVRSAGATFYAPLPRGGRHVLLQAVGRPAADFWWTPA